MPAPAREGDTLVFRNARATVAVTAIAPEVVRVRIAPATRLGRDHSYAVVSRDLGTPGAADIRIGPRETTLTTTALRVRLAHRPFGVTIADRAGRVLDEDAAGLGLNVAAPATKVYKRLRHDDQIYGFGSKSGRLNRRGKMRGGYYYTMWNTDAYGYDWGTDPIYASFPVYLVVNQGRAHGVFVDNTFRTSFDIGKEFPDALGITTTGGELDYYFIDGPEPKQVLERYATLTGRMPLPPLWALGLHQSRWSYYPDSRVRFIADNFRQRGIPADTLWLDIHALDGYNPLTWDPQRFPDPRGLVQELAAQGFHTVVIVDPHPKKAPGWDVYDSGVAGGHFVTNPDGSLFEANVWPANAREGAGPSVFPDFSRPATRAWWGALYKRLTDIGMAGIWNDMNEPAVFTAPFWTMPLEVRHDNEGEPTDHREIHNVYGQLMTRATYEGLLTLRPGERPFVLTRATFAGGQRYAALWPGDNQSRWEDLRHSLPILNSLGLAGMPFVGVDIGGFGDSPTAELFTRWLQAGVFYPFMRIHSADGTNDQEPWSFGVEHERVNRRAIELRYELLPHVYNEMHRASTTGVPAMRPLVLEFPADPRTYEMDDQFMFGAELLVAPVLFEAHRTRDVYLPAGDWYDFWTGARFEGGRVHRLEVTLASIPVFVRAGGMVFGQPAVAHTGLMPGNALRVTMFPAAESARTLYEDDGVSFAYREGGFLSRTFAQQREGTAAASGRVQVSVGAPDGTWRPAPRALELRLVGLKAPAAVRLVGADGASEPLPEASEAGATGWRMDGTTLVVRVDDRFAAFSVIVDPS